jgi:hypothetical protein
MTIENRPSPPTEADMERVRQIAALPEDVIGSLVDDYRTNPPAGYAPMFDNLATGRESLEAAHVIIDTDDSLGLAERVALRSVLSERWQLEQEKTFPEALNY